MTEEKALRWTERLARQLTLTDMTEGNPYRLLLKFSLPLLVGNIFQQLYNTVDSIVVGNVVGSQALAAVGLGFPFIMMLSSLFIGFGMGAMVIVSQYFGARQQEDLRKTVGTVYRVMLIGVIPLTLLGLLMARPVLVLMKVPDDGTLDLALTYLRIIFIGLIGSLGYNVNAGLLQGLGDSFSSLLFLISATGINIVLDLVFTINLGMGVMGVALATMIAQFISWVLGIYFINSKYPYLRISLFHLPFDAHIFKRAIKLGIPSSVQHMLFSLGIMVISSLVNQQGSLFAAGFNGANKIDSFVFMPVQSFSIAITTYTAQNMGARNTERLQKGRHAGMILSIGLAFISGWLLYPFSAAAMGLFSPNMEVVRSGVVYLHAVLPFYALLGALFSVNAMLRGMGKMTVAMLSTFVSFWVARIPAAYLLRHFFGGEAIYFSYAVGWLGGLLISLSYYHFGKWRQDIYREMNEYIKE